MNVLSNQNEAEGILRSKYMHTSIEVCTSNEVLCSGVVLDLISRNLNESPPFGVTITKAVKPKPKYNLDSFCAGTIFIRQNLTSHTAHIAYIALYY